MSVKKLFDLCGRVAIVTGGSRGLGLQIAEALGEMGAQARADRAQEGRARARGRAPREAGHRRRTPLSATSAGATAFPASSTQMLKKPRPRRHPGQQRRRSLGRARPKTIRWKPGTSWSTST